MWSLFCAHNEPTAHLQHPGLRVALTSTRQAPAMLLILCTRGKLGSRWPVHCPGLSRASSGGLSPLWSHP